MNIMVRQQVEEWGLESSISWRQKWF